MPNPKTRGTLLLATARKNPEFAARLVQNLPEDTRCEVLSELSRHETRAVTSLSRPGLRKCHTSASVNNGLSAQLNMFAKAVSRVS